MFKFEIIEAVGYAATPLGDDGVDSLQIMEAMAFSERLERNTAQFSEVPDARLFEHIHIASMEFYQHVISSDPGYKEKAIENYRKIISHLQEIAQKLGITYEIPDDPLLQ